MSVREIETNRLRLQPIGLDDAKALHELWIDPGVRRYLWDDEIISQEQTFSAVETSIGLFKESGLGLWTVSPRNEERLIGFCGFWFFHEPPQLELLYGIASEDWGKGLATEAARTMIRYGFEDLALDRIQASADAPNRASFRVMEKAGMIFEKREAAKGLDTIYYSIGRDSFQTGDDLYLAHRA